MRGVRKRVQSDCRLGQGVLIQPAGARQILRMMQHNISIYTYIDVHGIKVNKIFKKPLQSQGFFDIIYW
jgi:hypothetical protein